jgi:CubicO group peptidase (beta-lactamase class C family)
VHDDLVAAIDGAIAESGFTGVVRVDLGAEVLHASAHGLADRAHGVPNTVDTRFAMASGCKTFTAATVLSLVADGTLTLDTSARSVLAADLPLIDERVTVEHLLGHTSGIGDYFEEDASGPITDYVLPVSAHRLDRTEAYLEVLDGYPQVFEPGTRFAYNNGAYVVAALIAERAVGVPFADLVAERVFTPAGMARSGYLRSDELPGDAAIGYLEAGSARTNIFHLPVLGSGDGGAYTTVDDVHRFWPALLGGAILPGPLVATMTEPRSDPPHEPQRYAFGLWVDQDGPGLQMEGYDAGVSFRSHHDPATGVTWTAVANWSEGAWPVARAIAAWEAATPWKRSGTASVDTPGGSP